MPPMDLKSRDPIERLEALADSGDAGEAEWRVALAAALRQIRDDARPAMPLPACVDLETAMLIAGIHSASAWKRWKARYSLRGMSHGLYSRRAVEAAKERQAVNGFGAGRTRAKKTAAKLTSTQPTPFPPQPPSAPAASQHAA